MNDASAQRSGSAPAAPGCVVVAGDDRGTRDEIAALLRAEGHTVELCDDGQEALSRVAIGGIDLVIVDAAMQRLSGLETCRLLKTLAGVAYVPLVLVTPRNDAASRVEGLRIGADGWLEKPVDRDELSARVVAMLRIRRLVAGLADERDRLLRRSMHDDLTGLPNRRCFEARLAEEHKRAERYHEPFACVLAGIAQGAPTRDMIAGGPLERMVIRGALSVRRIVREGDVVARVGDATLGVILTHTHFAGTIAATERVYREMLGALSDSSARVAIGAALFPSRDARTAGAMLASAETALDEAWSRGGEQICVLQQRKYMYTPGTAPRSERPPPVTRTPQSEPPPSVRRFQSEPPTSVRSFSTDAPASVRRFQSEPPTSVRAFTAEAPASVRHPPNETPAGAADPPAREGEPRRPACEGEPRPPAREGEGRRG